MFSLITYVFHKFQSFHAISLLISLVLSILQPNNECEMRQNWWNIDVTTLHRRTDVKKLVLCIHFQKKKVNTNPVANIFIYNAWGTPQRGDRKCVRAKGVK